MNTLLKFLLASTLAACASLGLAQSGSTATDHAAHHGPSAAANTDMTEGEVRKVDKSAGKITLKHGAIKNLDMPPMTMVFQVADPKLLDKVQAGDKVRFVAESIGGKFTVTDLQPAP